MKIFLRLRLGMCVTAPADVYEVVAEAVREMPITDQHKAWRPPK